MGDGAGGGRLIIGRGRTTSHARSGALRQERDLAAVLLTTRILGLFGFKRLRPGHPLQTVWESGQPIPSHRRFSRWAFPAIA